MMSRKVDILHFKRYRNSRLTTNKQPTIRCNLKPVSFYKTQNKKHTRATVIKRMNNAFVPFGPFSPKAKPMNPTPSLLVCDQPSSYCSLFFITTHYRNTNPRAARPAIHDSVLLSSPAERLPSLPSFQAFQALQAPLGPLAPVLAPN